MEAAAAFLEGPAEVIAAFDRGDIAGGHYRDDDFVEMLSRRPMTALDLSKALGLSLVQVVARLKRLRDTAAFPMTGTMTRNFTAIKLRPYTREDGRIPKYPGK